MSYKKIFQSGLFRAGLFASGLYRGRGPIRQLGGFRCSAIAILHSGATAARVM